MFHLIKISITLALMFFVCPVSADAVVCIDNAGKKVFLNEPCQNKGFKNGTHDFPVVSGQSIKAIVIPPSSLIKDDKLDDANWNFRKGEFKINTYVLIFLILSLFTMAFILSYQVVRYFKSYKEKLIWEKEKN